MTAYAATGFLARHLGPRPDDIALMLERLGLDSVDQLVEQVVPDTIRDTASLRLPAELRQPLSEEQALAELERIANQNQLRQSLIGQGYYGTHTPQVVLRNVLLNPGWYTAYTPYQPEISQGRLEVLFQFQTLVKELTGLDIANASMLDEGTAAAEAMTLCHRSLRAKRHVFFVSKFCHPQTISILQTRAEPLGIELALFDEADLAELDFSPAFAVLCQYPRTDGEVVDYTALSEQAHQAGAMVIMAADPLSLVLLKTPADMGADVAVGSMQRFGVPMGFGGPHAAYLATKDKLKRSMPGRLIGLSRDAAGRPAYRLALQTREQHIRREKATSNICTAQALLAIMATLYAAYHGPKGLQQIAEQVALKTKALKGALVEMGYQVATEVAFDTLSLEVGDSSAALLAAADEAGFNLRVIDAQRLGIALDETVSIEALEALLGVFARHKGRSWPMGSLSLGTTLFSESMRREQLPLLDQEMFTRYHSETEMMRYLRRLADRDIALDRAMIPLGSCTMKLNAAAEMAPITWPLFAQIHPFAPAAQTQGYLQMIEDLEQMLCACTGYDAMSLQPNAGSQGEYAGLLAIRRYQESLGQSQRNICLIPSSAHGTNPASAQMAGMQVVSVDCDEQGNIDVADLQAKLAAHADKVAAMMITYPSTHGVFEPAVREVCELVHAAGGQVYIDGANLNAQIGLASPGQYGGDVSHLNLHKTFCIPHGGGGPGVGPIGVGEHLKPFLPGHLNLASARDAVSAAPYGSASILPITWMYCRMMGEEGLKRASEIALLNANYVAARLSEKYTVLYSGENGRVAHECIIDVRPLKERAGVSVDDIAKRLIDYGFHAPTMSFPVAGTLMIEPTESESLQELDRFCEAMLAIYAEYEAILHGEYAYDQSPLHFAPHTAYDLLDSQWQRPYTARQAAYPMGLDGQLQKYWPPVSRVDNVHGDKHLVCSCLPMSAYR